MTTSSFSSFKLSPELQAMIRRRLNFHRVLWVLTLVVFFIAWNRGLALLYGLFSLLLALVLISYLMPNWQLRKISVTRQSSGEFTAGKPGSIVYRLETNRVRYHVELIESLEFAEKKEQHVFFSKVSGRASCKLHFTCLQRGCFRLSDCQLSSAYPFGVFKLLKSVHSNPVEVLVFPKVVDLARLPVPLVADAATWGDVLVPQKGGRDEYTAVREYSQGDELNRIHWPVSARHQHLVVKQYEKTDRPAMLVVLDCRRQFNVGEGHLTTFEFAVSIAASMIRFASREGIQCILAAHGDPLQELTIRAYCSDFYALYASLARMTCDARHPYPPVVEQAHRQFPKANLIATFRLDSNPARPSLPPYVTQIDLEMDENSFRAPEQPAPKKRLRREGNRWVCPVYANRRLEELFQ